MTTSHAIGLAAAVWIATLAGCCVCPRVGRAPECVPPTPRMAAFTEAQAESAPWLGFAENAPFAMDLTAADLTSLDTMDGVWIITTLRPPAGVAPADAENLMRRYSTGGWWGTITPVHDARTYVVIDFAPNVAAMCRALQGLRETQASSR